MAAKARRKKKTVRAAKPAPTTRKRRAVRMSAAKAVDPILALGQYREKLATLFEEVRKTQEVTLQGVRLLVETTGAQMRSVSEHLTAEMEKLDEQCRKAKERQREAASATVDAWEECEREAPAASDP